MTWWRHQIEIFPCYWPFAGNSPVTGEFPSQRQVTRSFDVFFDLRLNKRLSRHLRCRCFETSWRSWWRHCNDHLVLWFPIERQMGTKSGSTAFSVNIRTQVMACCLTTPSHYWLTNIVASHWTQWVDRMRWKKLLYSTFFLFGSTHWGQGTHICVSELGHHWFI